MAVYGNPTNKKTRQSRLLSINAMWVYSYSAGVLTHKHYKMSAEHGEAHQLWGQHAGL